jgi:hypothetical protein
MRVSQLRVTVQTQRLLPVEDEEFGRFPVVFRLCPTPRQKTGNADRKRHEFVEHAAGRAIQGVLCAPVFAAFAIKEPIRRGIVHYEHQKFLAFFAIFLFFLFTLLRSIR